MKNVTFIFEENICFEKAKRELSQYAARALDKEGNTQFAGLVLDEENRMLFVDLFRAATAQLQARAAAYMRLFPDKSLYIESERYEAKDFTMTLLLPDNYNNAFIEPANERADEFITAYVAYRWLETKAPDISAIYRDRANAALDKFQVYINKTKYMTRRPAGWF